MQNFIGNLMYFLITFVVIFIFLLIRYFINKKNQRLSEMRELTLISVRFKIKRKDLAEEKLGIIFALINSFIISVTAVISTLITLKYIWQIVISLALLLCLIYIMYGIVGKIIVRKLRKVR